MANIREEARGPLGSITDLVAAKEIGKLWSAVESIRGYSGGTEITAVTRAELKALENAVYARIDDLQNKPFDRGGGASGGSFTSVGSSLDVRPLDNLWSGTNKWSVDGAPASSMKYEPSLGHLISIRDDALPLAVYPYEVGNFFADTTYRAANSLSIVPVHMHATSADDHAGNVWGLATEAYNDTSKQGKASTTQLFGAEVSIISKVWDSQAMRHAGLLTVFKNRMDVDPNPDNPDGPPPANRSYNKSAIAIYIDTGAGRGSDTSIQCGWYRGIYFSPHSLDSSNGNIWAFDNGKAVGIDMGDLEGFAPEGGRFYQRLNAAIALPPNTGISWDGSPKAVQTRFNDGTGDFEFRVGSTANAAINFSTGVLKQGGGLPYYLNLGAAGSQLFTMVSSNKIKSDLFLPSYTFAVMAKVLIDGVQYYIPVYRL